MATALHIASRLHVSPLVDIHHPSFEKCYRDGVCWSLFVKPQPYPLTDSFILKYLREILKEPDENHCQEQASWLPVIGFHVGRLHGAILSAKTGQPRPDVTMLARFDNEHAERGYTVGREWYFLEAQPDERISTDYALVERLQEIERDSAQFHDEQGTWFYALGCILGELSGQLFPATSQEYAQWEENSRKWRAEYEREIDQHAATESLDPVSIVEYTV